MDDVQSKCHVRYFFGHSLLLYSVVKLGGITCLLDQKLQIQVFSFMNEFSVKQMIILFVAESSVIM